MLKIIIFCQLFLILPINGELANSKNAIQCTNDVEIQWEKVNITKLISIIPQDIKEVFDNITTENTLYLQNILHTLYRFVTSDNTKVNEKILDKFTHTNVSLVEEFKNLWVRMIGGSNGITKNGNEFLKKLIQFHYTVLEYVTSDKETTIDYKRLREEVYKIAQEYLNLTNNDRNSFSSSFPSLSNFFNNKILLDALREIKPNSSIKDYTNIRNKLINAIIEKKLSK
uniref:Fatty-acid and retinol-binding protein 1 n=1 Tax=Strongyloides papillosus TaxID=174720 RepID=A0A0N5B990_STREA